MKPALQLRLGHQLAMTPQLQKAIRLLQLSAHELHCEMQLALETNPMLEMNEEALTQEESAGSMGDQPNPEEEAVEFPYTASRNTSSSDRDDDAVDEAVVNALCQDHSTLQEHLMWQMNLFPFSEAERWIATYLIDAINEDGFINGVFSELVKDIQLTLDVSQALIETVLQRIQQFDPIGVGARDLRECLLLQLAQLPLNTPSLVAAKTLVKQYLDLLGKRDYPLLQKRLGVNTQGLSDIVALIQTLNPRPGTLIGRRTAQYILPDLYASMTQEGGWKVALNPLSMLHLRVNPLYIHQLPSQNARDQRYMKEQLQEAQWLLNSIEHRNQTLLKVGRYLVEYQAPFLILGDEALKPLDLTQVATQLNMHESTISRITMHKTMDTPRGLLELKAFFSNPISREQGEACSGGAIRGILRKLIAAEDPKKPLSDERLSQVLKTQGIPVARRTITKYRETLRIPPAHERKQLC